LALVHPSGDSDQHEPKRIQNSRHLDTQLSRASKPCGDERVQIQGDPVSGPYGIHLDGPGKFYLTGHNARFIDVERLNLDLHDMARMSSLQGSLFEIISTSDEIAVVGASVSADRAQYAL